MMITTWDQKLLLNREQGWVWKGCIVKGPLNCGGAHACHVLCIWVRFCSPATDKKGQRRLFSKGSVGKQHVF